MNVSFFDTPCTYYTTNCHHDHRNIIGIIRKMVIPTKTLPYQTNKEGDILHEFSQNAGQF